MCSTYLFYRLKLKLSLLSLSSQLFSYCAYLFIRSILYAWQFCKLFNICNRSKCKFNLQTANVIPNKYALNLSWRNYINKLEITSVATELPCNASFPPLTQQQTSRPTKPTTQQTSSKMLTGPTR